jgi:hypothetical protein
MARPKKNLKTTSIQTKKNSDFNIEDDKMAEIFLVRVLLKSMETKKYL